MALAVSLLLLVVGIPFMPALVGQILDFHPYVSSDTWATCSGIAAQAVVQRTEIIALRRACRRMGRSEKVTPAELDSYRRVDRGNGLYAWLELLLLLRQTEADDATLLAELRRATTGIPPRLYLQTQYERAVAALKARGVPPRRAALAAALLPHQVESLRSVHEPVLRELADRLIDQGRRWREAGRPEPALQAHAAVVQLLTDLAKESPHPELALLASEWSAVALNEIAADLKDSRVSTRPAATAPADVPLDFDEWTRMADAAASLRERWHEVASADGVSVMPYTGVTLHVLAVPAAYRRVMFWLGILCVAVATFALMTITWLVTALIASMSVIPEDRRPTWRWGRRGACVAGLIVCTPILLTGALLATSSVDYSWLFSLPTLSAMSLSPVLGIVLVGLAARATTVLPASSPEIRWSGRSAWLVVGVLAATLLAGVLLRPSGSPAASVPQGTLALRTTMWLLGLASCLVLAAWGLYGSLTGSRRASLWLPSTRVYLRVASAGLVGTGLLLLLAMICNARADRNYQETFEQAMADPLSHRLGGDWYDRYFAGARQTIEQLHAASAN